MFARIGSGHYLSDSSECEKHARLITVGIAIKYLKRSQCVLNGSLRSLVSCGARGISFRAIFKIFSTFWMLLSKIDSFDHFLTNHQSLERRECYFQIARRCAKAIYRSSLHVRHHVASTMIIIIIMYEYRSFRVYKFFKLNPYNTI